MEEIVQSESSKDGTHKHIRRKSAQKKILTIFFYVLFCFIMALIFIELEYKNDADYRARFNAKLQKSVLEIQKNCPLLNEKNITAMGFRQFAHEKLDEIYRLKEELGIGDDYRKETWTFYGSFFFVLTTTTTIGYGHPAPKTPNGRLTTMFLYIVGVPFTFMALMDLVDIILTCEKFIMNYIGRKLSNFIDKFHIREKIRNKILKLQAQNKNKKTKNIKGNKRRRFCWFTSNAVAPLNTDQNNTKEKLQVRGSTKVIGQNKSIVSTTSSKKSRNVSFAGLQSSKHSIRSTNSRKKDTASANSKKSPEVIVHKRRHTKSGSKHSLDTRQKSGGSLNKDDPREQKRKGDIQKDAVKRQRLQEQMTVDKARNSVELRKVKSVNESAEMLVKSTPATPNQKPDHVIIDMEVSVNEPRNTPSPHSRSTSRHHDRHNSNKREHPSSQSVKNSAQTLISKESSMRQDSAIPRKKPDHVIIQMEEDDGEQTQSVISTKTSSLMESVRSSWNSLKNRFSSKNSRNISVPIQIAIESPSQTNVPAPKIEAQKEREKTKHRRKKHRSKSLHHSSHHRRSGRHKHRSKEDKDRNDMIHESHKKRHLDDETSISQYGKRTSPTFHHDDVLALQSPNQRRPSVVTSLPHGFQPGTDETVIQRKSPVSPETGYIRQLHEYHQSHESNHLPKSRTHTPTMPLPGQVSVGHVENENKDSHVMINNSSYRNAKSTTSYGHSLPHSSTNRHGSKHSSIYTPADFENRNMVIPSSNRSQKSSAHSSKRSSRHSSKHSSRHSSKRSSRISHRRSSGLSNLTGTLPRSRRQSGKSSRTSSKKRASSQESKQWSQLQRQYQESKEKILEETQSLPHITLCFAMVNLVIYICIGAQLYVKAEGWTYMDAIYFIMTSISTVGLGDMMPSNEIFLLYSFFYLLLGLALLAKVIGDIRVSMVKVMTRSVNTIEDVGHMAKKKIVKTSKRLSAITRRSSKLKSRQSKSIGSAGSKQLKAGSGSYQSHWPEHLPLPGHPQSASPSSLHPHWHALNSDIEEVSEVNQ